MDTSERNLTGLSGWVADVMESMGALGVGLLTLLETVFPPLPSEVILPLAGFLTQQGELDIVAVLFAATLGSVTGAVVLYELGRRLGLERGTRTLARVPLLDREDVVRAAAWFTRHGRAAVFFGRLVPGVRSLISLPAGAAKMPRGTFVVYTTAGSGLWNALLVGGGVWLGTEWERVEAYAGYLDLVVYGAFAVLLAAGVTRRLRQRRAGSTPQR